MQQLQTQPVNYPVGFAAETCRTGGIRTPGDLETLYRLADEAKTLLRNNPLTERSVMTGRTVTVNLEVDLDRASLAGISSYDVAYSSALAINGIEMTELREGDKQIPVIMRLRPSERAQLSDLNNMYVYSNDSAASCPNGGCRHQQLPGNQ